MAVWAALRPSERLSALTLGGLLGLAALARPAGWGIAALGWLGLLVATLAAPRMPERLRWLRDALPVALVLGIFLLLQPLAAGLAPRRWDAALAAFDARWCAGLVASWRGAFGRPAWFTDLVYLAYVSFYFLPLSVAVAARIRLGEEAFEQVAFPLLLGFYLSFAGYLLWPAEGPRVPQSAEQALLGGGPLAAGVRAFLRASERTTLDAFPSGHTALSVLPALLATTRFGPRAWPAWPWTLAIVFATVYISVHYVADVLAGLALAGLAWFAAGPLSRALGGAARA